jgi:hypothetical protein
MTNHPDTLAALYTAWLEKKGLNAKEAAPLVGCSVATSYEYAAGLSVPPSTRLPQFAEALGEDVRRVLRIAAKDRPVCRRRKARLHAPRRTKAGAA